MFKVPELELAVKQLWCGGVDWTGMVGYASCGGNNSELTIVMAGSPRRKLY